MRSSLALVALPSSTFCRLRAGLLAAVAGGALLLATTPAAAQSKVAVIDVRRAVLETEQGLRVQAQLKKLFDTRQIEIDGKQRQLLADKEAFTKEAQANKTPKEQIQKKYETLQRAEIELQTSVAESQREMQRKEGEMTTPILQGVLDAVKRIASQEGFEMVLEKSAVPYFRGDLELTDRAIQLYNSGQPGGAAPAGKGAPSAPAGKGAPDVKPAVPAPAPKPAPKK